MLAARKRTVPFRLIPETESLSPDVLCYRIGLCCWFGPLGGRGKPAISGRFILAVKGKNSERCDEPSSILLLPEYDRAWGEFFFVALQELMADAHPLLRQIKRRSDQPLGPVQYADQGEPLTQEPISVQASFQLEEQAFLLTDVEAILTAIANAAYDTVEPFMRGFYEQFAEICKSVGTAVDCQGKPMTWDLFLDVLDRMEIEFDENGRPSIPTYLGGSPESIKALRSQPFTQAHQERLDAILQRNREEHDARKRHRRLS